MRAVEQFKRRRIRFFAFWIGILLILLIAGVVLILFRQLIPGIVSISIASLYAMAFPNLFLSSRLSVTPEDPLTSPDRLEIMEKDGQYYAVVWFGAEKPRDILEKPDGMKADVFRVIDAALVRRFPEYAVFQLELRRREGAETDSKRAILFKDELGYERFLR